MKQSLYFLLGFVLAVTIVTHFYNLNWGAPFYFHPDERNIASAISQLNFPAQMNPHFFAYGSFPIYAIYATGVISNLIFHHLPITNVAFEQAILISRYFSAVLSLLLLPLLFVIGKQISNVKTGTYAMLFAATSTGFIQFAHFGTFELWTTFFATALLLCCMYLCKKPALKTTVITGIVLGILVAVKASNLVFIALPLLSFFLYSFKHKKNLKQLSLVVMHLVLVYLLATGIVLASNPYMLFDNQEFNGSINYESQVGFGTLPVFYTQEFFGKIPILFQITSIYPFLLNPLVTLLLCLSFVYGWYLLLRKRQQSHLLLMLFFCAAFFSQAFLFAKWTRYMVPTLPFAYLLIALLLSEPLTRSPLAKKIKNLTTWVLISICMVFALAYFITAFVEKDTRIEAAIWAKYHIASTTPVASEVYDLGITTFNPYLSNIDLYNPYDYDQGGQLNIMQEYQTHDMIILPSQRIVKTRLLDAKRFPKGHLLYTQLFDGSLGFTQIYQTPCDLFCQITYLGDPVMRFEETASVFDRPVVFIFKKQQ